ncbi:Vta1 like-domain-containing protein [Mycena metata]|uniref:Vta1 like-domain-containing protein n=1 Tax=Mycena metata TaxID=1033252 RepID=A0AAD7KJM6_9AGAR|nr:Vta1 like-domain-containing protein [Mycena metata]
MALPPTPAPLKSVFPYLQRADELRAKEPIIAYWCTYYAAQVGIALKAKDAASRNFLFELLGALEKMKQDIGPTDAIDIEAASAAFVENFALRVFAMADNEDRSGAGNRSTAKKFLAAANFLEVLKTFPKAEVSESNEEKIRYAKWKAADIAKAYREGRKPTPGPAGSDSGIDAELLELQNTTAPTFLNTPSFTSIESNTSSSTTARGSTPTPSQTPPSGGSPPKVVKRTSPRMGSADIANANRDFSPQTPPRRGANLGVDVGLHPGAWGGEHAGQATPGSWSTAATPGTANTPQEPIDPLHSPTLHQRSGSGSSSGSGGGLLMKPDGPLPYKSSWKQRGEEVCGLSSTDGTPPVSPIYHSGPPHEPWQAPGGSAPYNGIDLPPGFVPHPNQPVFTPGAQGPPFHESPPPPQPPHGGLYASAPPLPPAPGGLYASAPPPPPHVPTPVVPPPPTYVSPPTLLSPPPPPQLEPEVELTPSIIAKAQKHCRFAISALDYEDAEQARRELRAALAVLGG